MFKEKLQSRKESNKDKLLDCAGGLIPQVVYHFAMNSESYPRCCHEVSYNVGVGFKQQTGIRLKICRGSVYIKPTDQICGDHTWLEYGDLVIDPTDFQFNVVDMGELEPILENMLPDDLKYIADLGVGEKEAAIAQNEQAIIDTWLDNSLKRHYEKPNDKERYFQTINELLKEEKIDPNDYIEELSRCFGFRAFYEKENKYRVYESNYVEPVIVNDTIRRLARFVFGRV